MPAKKTKTPGAVPIEEGSASSEDSQDSLSDESALEEGRLASGSPRAPSKKMKKVKTTPMEMLAAGTAVAAVATSVAAMALNPLGPVIIAGSLSSAIGPYAYYQQTQLKDIRAMEETHLAFKEEVDRLHKENARLNAVVGELSNTIGKLEDVEQALDVITQMQGQSVEAFAEQVKDNQNILDQMQMTLKANVLQNLLQVVIRSDKDGNMQIEEDEIDDLSARMNKINGVTVRRTLFKERILSDSDGSGCLEGVMNIIKNLMNENDGEDAIFIIEEEEEGE